MPEAEPSLLPKSSGHVELNARYGSAPLPPPDRLRDPPDPGGDHDLLGGRGQRPAALNPRAACSAARSYCSSTSAWHPGGSADPALRRGFRHPPATTRELLDQNHVACAHFHRKAAAVSLTSELKRKDSPLAQFFRQTLPNARDSLAENREALRGREPICELRGEEPAFAHSVVGMAVDYRIRYSFAPTPAEDLVAWRGARAFQTGRVRNSRMSSTMQCHQRTHGSNRTNPQAWSTSTGCARGASKGASGQGSWRMRSTTRLSFGKQRSPDSSTFSVKPSRGSLLIGSGPHRTTNES